MLSRLFATTVPTGFMGRDADTCSGSGVRKGPERFATPAGANGNGRAFASAVQQSGGRYWDRPVTLPCEGSALPLS